MPIKQNLEGIYNEKKWRVVGKIVKEAEVKNGNSWLRISKSSREEMVTYESKGLVASINGSGSLKQDHPQCQQAEQMGKFLMEQGGIVMNGGRSSGIMESSSKAAGDNSLGILFPEIEKENNSYGSKVVVSSPQTRIELLATCAPLVIVFRGGLGTVMVLMRSIVHLKNRKYHAQQLPQMVFVSNYWMGLLHTMMSLGAIPSDFLASLIFFSTAQDIIKRLPKQNKI